MGCDKDWALLLMKEVTLGIDSCVWWKVLPSPPVNYAFPSPLRPWECSLLPPPPTRTPPKCISSFHRYIRKMKFRVWVPQMDKLHLFLFQIIFLNWRIVDLQYCVSFNWTEKWFNYIYVYVYILFFFLIHFHCSVEGTSLKGGKSDRNLLN